MPVVGLLVITLLAGGAATALNTVLGRVVAPDPGVLAALDSDEGAPVVEAASGEAAASAARTPTARAKSGRQYIDTILRRNIFDPEFIKTYAPNRGSTTSSGTSEAITDLKVRLVGTMVAVPASLSSALIELEGGDSFGYSIGDKIQDAEVVAIAPKRVTLRRGDGREEFLEMNEEGAPKRTPAASNASEGSSEGGVEQLGDNRYAVDRSLINEYIGDIDSISRLGRALPHRGPDGEFDGYRLSAIRRNTLADQLGIKNGDVVHTVNGAVLNSVPSAMNAYQTMMNEDSFSFEVTRRGQRMTLEYEIR